MVVLVIGFWVLAAGPPLIRLFRTRRRVTRMRRGQASVGERHPGIPEARLLPRSSPLRSPPPNWVRRSES
ncbi:hypothetical protein SBA6_270035 [Candidatus Sulfopaludibacter sp. SbA6]|nr:hypothetical protein SBA6_270035 [Candidatus Sulfopaludibacter sp. SbA6]